MSTYVPLSLPGILAALVTTARWDTSNNGTDLTCTVLEEYNKTEAGKKAIEEMLALVQKHPLVPALPFDYQKNKLNWDAIHADLQKQIKWRAQ